MDRFVCTKEHPWNPNSAIKGERVCHPDAFSVDCEDGHESYCCPYCGYIFCEELEE
jgi:hypothetical protein